MTCLQSAKLERGRDGARMISGIWKLNRGESETCEIVFNKGNSTEKRSREPRAQLFTSEVFK